jgi:hypothetical protein
LISAISRSFFAKSLSRPTPKAAIFETSSSSMPRTSCYLLIIGRQKMGDQLLVPGDFALAAVIAVSPSACLAGTLNSAAAFSIAARLRPVPQPRPAKTPLAAIL